LMQCCFLSCSDLTLELLLADKRRNFLRRDPNSNSSGSSGHKREVSFLNFLQQPSSMPRLVANLADKPPFGADLSAFKTCHLEYPLSNGLVSLKYLYTRKVAYVSYETQFTLLCFISFYYHIITITYYLLFIKVRAQIFYLPLLNFSRNFRISCHCIPNRFFINWCVILLYHLASLLSAGDH